MVFVLVFLCNPKQGWLQAETPGKPERNRGDTAQAMGVSYFETHPLIPFKDCLLEGRFKVSLSMCLAVDIARFSMGNTLTSDWWE